MKRVVIWTLIAVFAIVGIVIAINAIGTWLELDRLSARVQASTGSPDESKAEIKGSIENVHQAAEVTRDEAAWVLAACMRCLHSNSSDAESFSVQVIKISKEWHRDFTEVSAVASSLMVRSNLTEQEAFDLIVSNLRTTGDLA